MSLVHLQVIWPSIACFAFGLLILIYDVIAKERNAAVSLSVTIFALLVAFGFNASIDLSHPGPVEELAGAVSVDGFGVFVVYVLLLAGLGSLLIGYDNLKRLGVNIPEYNPLVLFALSGMTLLAVANDLILVFLAIELMSLAIYVLAASNRGEIKAVEGAAKYFIMGAFASAILLYGIAFVYGATGSTRIDAVGAWIAHNGHSLGSSPLLAVGVAMLLAGFGFKVAAAPFHMWAPDVYQGAPTPVTALMATAVKAAAFAAFARLMFVGLLGGKADWVAVLWGISALTILWGNIGALVQKDLKRMLAYSSVGHAGYLLMALVAAPADGLAGNPRISGLLFYLLSYTLMSVAAFGAVSLLTARGEDDTRIERLRGLASTHPLLAAGLTVALLSLAGIPPTMGFVGKFYLFAAAVEGGYTGLAVVGAFGGALGVYYYLRPIVLMYMTGDEGREAAPAVNTAALGALGVAVVALLVLGVFPGPVVDWCRDSLLSLVGAAHG